MKEREKTIRVINVRACRGVGDRKWDIGRKNEGKN